MAVAATVATKSEVELSLMASRLPLLLRLVLLRLVLPLSRSRPCEATCFLPLSSAATASPRVAAERCPMALVSARLSPWSFTARLQRGGGVLLLARLCCVSAELTKRSRFAAAIIDSMGPCPVQSALSSCGGVSVTFDGGSSSGSARGGV